MKVLLLSSAYNSLAQNAHVWLQSRHDVAVATGLTGNGMREAVGRHQPDLILCPMLAQIIPPDIWENYACLVLHPGIIGDRSSASLDWAILNEEQEWGVTVVQAADHVDSGTIWASYRFNMRAASKSSLYRDEVAHAAMKAMKLAVQRFENGLFEPAPLDYSGSEVKGQFRPAVPTKLRRIDWSSDSVAVILKKIRSADGSPGVLDEIAGEHVYLYGAHEEGSLIGNPGDIIAQRHGAICRAASDGGVWISHLRRKGARQDGHFKLPAAEVLGDQLADVPEVPVPLHYIWYEEANDVGYVNFRFYNGAMGAEHCRRLTEAVMYARSRPTKIIVLSGGRDFFSNGIHLNLIEAAADPAEESWRNIEAMDDLVYAILTTTEHITVSAMHGSAGAGGVMLAIAADRALVRDGVVLNPHYKGMGGLYGSEYWTYSLEKRVGFDMAQDLTEQCLPINVQTAKAIGLIDDFIVQDDSANRFRDQIVRIAEKLARSEHFNILLNRKRVVREHEEAIKPLADYRAEELTEMKRNFWGKDRSYHIARTAFVHKQAQPLTTQLHQSPTTIDCNGDRPTVPDYSGKTRRAEASIGWSGNWQQIENIHPKHKSLFAELLEHCEQEAQHMA